VPMNGGVNWQTGGHVDPYPSALDASITVLFTRPLYPQHLARNPSQKRDRPLQQPVKTFTPSTILKGSAPPFGITTGL
jgi:hypothetical protein